MKTETYSGLALTPKQQAKLDRASRKLPEGWTYEVSDDNRQILVKSNDGTVACATLRGHFVSGWVDCDLILLNRACAAVWGRQLSISK